MDTRRWAADLAAAALLSGPAAAAPVVDPLAQTDIYPIAVWAMPAATAPDFARLGVNLFIGGAHDAPAWCDSIAASGAVGFVGWSGRRSAAEARAIVASPGFLGWMHGDEPDNPEVVDDVFLDYHVSPQALAADLAAMRASSTPAPMYLNLGQGLANGAKQTTPDSVYPAFCATADIVSYDVYPTSTQGRGTERLHLVARGVERLRRFAGPDRPVWIWLECTAIDGQRSGLGNRAPLPHELRAEVWMAIVHGVDGVGYFPHQFDPYRGGPEAIPEAVQEEMARTNGLLHRLARVLRTGARRPLPVAAGAGRVSAALWRLEERTLVAVVNLRREAALATVSLPPGTGPLASLGDSGRGPLRVSDPAVALQPYEVALFAAGVEAPDLDYRYPAPPAAPAPVPAPAVLASVADLPPRMDRGWMAWSRSHNTRLAVPELAAAPAIDGDLGDEAWGRAEPLSGFASPDGSRRARWQTSAALGRFGDRLYLALRAEEDRLDSLVTRYPALWRNDCIEVWVDPDGRRTSFAHLVASADGRVAAARTVPDEWGEARRDEGWTPGVAGAAGRASGAWTLELSVPLADLGAADGGVVGFDLARERKPGGGENSVWTTGGFNEATTFGELTLAPAAVTLGSAALRNRGPEAVAATVEVLVSAPRAAAAYGNWEEPWTDLARQTRTVAVPAAGGPGQPGEVSLIDRELLERVPPGGRVRLTLLSPGPAQWEEWIANRPPAGDP